MLFKLTVKSEWLFLKYTITLVICVGKQTNNRQFWAGLKVQKIHFVEYCWTEIPQCIWFSTCCETEENCTKTLSQLNSQNVNHKLFYFTTCPAPKQLDRVAIISFFFSISMQKPTSIFSIAYLFFFLKFCTRKAKYFWGYQLLMM